MNSLDEQVLDGLRRGCFRAEAGPNREMAWGIEPHGDGWLRYQYEGGPERVEQEISATEACLLLQASGIRRRLIEKHGLLDANGPEMAKPLHQLLGIPAPPETAATNSLRICARLQKVPLAKLSGADVRRLLEQRIGLRYLLPLALKMLRKNPVVAVEYGTADLLLTTLKTFFQVRADLAARADFSRWAEAWQAEALHLGQVALDLLKGRNDPMASAINLEISNFCKY